MFLFDLAPGFPSSKFGTLLQAEQFWVFVAILLFCFVLFYSTWEKSVFDSSVLFMCIVSELVQLHELQNDDLTS